MQSKKIIWNMDKKFKYFTEQIYKFKYPTKN